MRRYARSKFIFKAVATGAGSVQFFSVPARAEFVYKVACAAPSDYPPTIALVQMAKAIKLETRGRLEIQVFPNNQLGSQTSMLAQVRLGSLQFFQNGNAQFSGIAPVAAIDSLGFAFASPDQALTAMDGPLGGYIRRELAAKGLYCFEKTYDIAFREVTSWPKPIKTADDFGGLKLRTPASPIFIEFFKAFGASPVPFDTNELYTALQTHVVDGQETPLVNVESFRFAEVQRYLSMTNHMWGGLWLVANMDAWKALPADVQRIVERNAAKYAVLERRSMQFLTKSLTNKLQREGLVANAVDTASMRARLGAYYSHWKNEFGSTVWSLLENAAGKIG